MCITEKKVPFKTVPLEQAVGTTLAHDMTQVVPGEHKGPAFKRGHKVTAGDLCRLMRMGKNHLYVLDLDDHQIHEDDAVSILAAALAGPGVTFSGSPSEGKLQITAAYPGLFKVNHQALTQFNLQPDVMCASIHNNTPVAAGQAVAATRAIPLVIDRTALDAAESLARDHYPILSVKLFNPLKVRLIITGNEVFQGLVEDRFQAIVEKKLAAFGGVCGRGGDFARRPGNDPGSCAGVPG